MAQSYLLMVVATFALFAWLTPTHELPWTTFHAEFSMAVAFLGLGAWVLWKRHHAAATMPISTVVTLTLALVPLLQLRCGLIAFRGDAVLPFLYLAGFGLAQLVGQRCVAIWGIGRVLKTFAGIVLLGAIVSAWLALCQWQRLDYLGFALSELPGDARPFANLNQPNLFATLLVLGLLATAILYDGGSFGPTGGLSLTVLLAFGLAMTQARAGMLEVAVVAALLLAKRRSLGGRLQWTHLLVGLSVVVATSLAWIALRNAAPVAPVTRDVTEVLRVGARGPHWSAMLDAVQRQPWSGYGWNQGAIAQYAVAPDHPAAPAVFDYGHNLLLDLLVWNGIPLGLAVSAGLGLWLWFAARSARESNSLLALACVAAVFAHAMVEYPLYLAYLLLPVGLLVGALCATTMPQLTIAVPAWLPALLLIVVGLTLVLICSDYLGLQEDVRSLRYERARIGVDRPRHELSRPLLLTQVGAFTKFARTPERKGMSEGELKLMSAVVQRFPSGENVVRYAAALALSDRAIEASEALRRVCKMSRPPTCEAMQRLWKGLGEREPVISSVAWPD